MADIGLDYAGNSPGAAAVKAAGYNFVARYLSRYTAKTIKKPEYDDMTSNDVGVVLVFEDYANQALQGFAQGVSDAQVALAQADALGWPDSRPIHFAVDFDISDAQKPVAASYMKGIQSVIGLSRTGAYGGYWWIKYCVDNGLASFFWQAVAWSGGMVHPSATLFQRLGGTSIGGTSCDINDALKPDYGQNNITGVDEMTDENYVRAFFLDLFTVSPTADQIAQYVNRDWKEVYNELRNAPPHQQLLDYYKAVIAEDGTRLATITQLQTQVANLQAQANSVPSTPLPEPATPSPSTPTTTAPQQSFFDWLKTIFGKK